MRTRATIPSCGSGRTISTKVIRTEEENFAKTIDSGLKIFGDMLAGHKAKGGEHLLRRRRFKLV